MAIPEQLERGNFGSSIGFVLAGAGSAIGLGNIWRFPYTAGENGGGAFLVVYLVFVVLIGLPVLLAELAMGRASQRNPVGAFKVLFPSRLWPLVGGMGVFTGFAILAFYSVVAGWTLGYLYEAATGVLSSGLTPEQSGALFEAIIGHPGIAIILTAMFLLLTVLVVRGGVHKGIERATTILMPLFFLLLVALAIRALTLPGAGQGVSFLFHADFSKITPKVAAAALGQALFSLSLGMGAMMTYGSYLPRRSNLVAAGASIAVFDTLIAILAGLIIFPALFSVGADPARGAGLVFVVLPTIFDNLPAGTLFAIAFYALLAIAALTSTISLLEVVTAYFVDERKWSRERAVWTIGIACFLLAIPSALSQGGNAFLSGLLGKGFLEIQNILFGNYALSVGALFICLFVAWRWGIRNAVEEMQTGGEAAPGHRLWGVLVRYVCPVAVIAVLGFLAITGEYF